MLVIEGGDLVGKSTLVKRAVERLNARGWPHMPMHLTRPPEDFDYYQGYVDKMSLETVWDRFHLSCLAYRRHDDRRCSMTPLKYELVDAAHRMLGGMVIVVTASAAVIEARYARRGDAMYDLPHTLDVNQTFIDMTGLRWITVRDAEYQYHIDASIFIKDESDESMQKANEWIDDVVDQYMRRLDELVAL